MSYFFQLACSGRGGSGSGTSTTLIASSGSGNRPLTDTDKYVLISFGCFFGLIFISVFCCVLVDTIQRMRQVDNDVDPLPPAPIILHFV